MCLQDYSIRSQQSSVLWRETERTCRSWGRRAGTKEGSAAVPGGCISCPIMTWPCIIFLHNKSKRVSEKLPPADAKSNAFMALHSSFLRKIKHY